MGVELIQNINLSPDLWLLNVAIKPYCRGKWVPVTTAWRVLRLWLEERPPVWRVTANILNKQSRTADTGWSSSLGFGRGAKLLL